YTNSGRAKLGTGTRNNLYTGDFSSQGRIYVLLTSDTNVVTADLLSRITKGGFVALNVQGRYNNFTQLLNVLSHCHINSIPTIDGDFLSFKTNECENEGSRSRG